MPTVITSEIAPKTIAKCHRAYWGLLCAPLTLPLWLAPAETAQAAKMIEEVVVTAQRRSQSTQDVPVAITGLTGDNLEKFGLENASDIGQQVPNMQVSGPYGDVQPIFAIRGVSMSDYNSNQASPIGVYVDEAYQPATYSHGANFFDIERLEVLRGPQGTLYGKNTTGGAINIITRTPGIDEGFSGRVKIGVASYNGVAVDAAVEDTLIEGMLAARFAMTSKKDDGYTENALGGSNASQTDSKGARLALNFIYGDHFSAVLKVTHMENDAYTTQVRNQPGVDVRDTLIGVGDSNGFIDYLGYSRPARDLDFHEVESNKVGPLITSTDTVTLSANYDFETFSITSISAYSDAQYFQAANTDGSPLSLLEIDWASDTVSYSQDLRISTQFDGWFNVIAGVYYGYEKLGLQNLYSFFEDFPDARVVEENPDTAGLAPFLIDYGILDQRLKTEKTSLAAYSQFRFQLSETIGIDFGMRYTEDQNDLPYYNTSRLSYDGEPRGTYVPGNPTGRDEAFTPAILSPNGIIACLNDFANCGLVPQYTHGPYTLASQPALSVTEREWTGKLGMDWKINEDIMVYASYSRGFRSGSYNGGVYYLERDIDDAYARPEFIDAYEVGIKADLLDGRARVNAAAFLYDYNDQQFVNVVGISVFLENAGASEIMGFEAEIQAGITERLSLQIGMGFLQTEYKELTLAETTTIADNNDSIDLAGNELISAPKVNASISLDYDVLVTEKGYLAANVNTSFQDDQWFSAYNDKAEYEETRQDAYFLTNARLSWFGADNRYTVALWGKNITDKEYDVYAIDIQASFGFTYFLPGAPRTYGLEMSYNF